MNTITFIIDKQFNTVSIEIRENGKHERYYHEVTESSKMRLLNFCGYMIEIFEGGKFMEVTYKLKHCSDFENAIENS